MKREAYGFTIVELLIVIVVVGILAAISIVAYNGVSNNANDSSVQSDLRQLGQMISMYHTENDAYPNLSQLRQYGDVRVSKNAYAATFIDTVALNYLYCYNNNNNTYGLVARSRSGSYFQYRDGVVSPYTGSVTTGVGSMCPNIGVSYLSRVWFYWDGGWQI